MYGPLSSSCDRGAVFHKARSFLTLRLFCKIPQNLHFYETKQCNEVLFSSNYQKKKKKKK
ncbi:hypothetical protein LDENG_00244730, partial [Lucifuga dentata]